MIKTPFDPLEPRYVETHAKEAEDGLPPFRVFDRHRHDWIAYCAHVDDCQTITTALNFIREERKL